MSFTTQRLVNSRVRVEGTDIFGANGVTVLDSTQWDEINSHKEYDQAAESFDAAVEEFFAPLTEAAEKIGKSLDKPEDSVGYVVLHEPTEGVAPVAGVTVKLTQDSIVLRLIEGGNTNRLVWVDDKLEVLAVADTPVELPIDDEPAASDPSFEG